MVQEWERFLKRAVASANVGIVTNPNMDDGVEALLLGREYEEDEKEPKGNPMHSEDEREQQEEKEGDALVMDIILESNINNNING